MKQNKNKNKDKDKNNEKHGSTPSNLNEKKYSSVKLKNSSKDKKKPNKVVRLQTCPTIQTTQF